MNIAFEELLRKLIAEGKDERGPSKTIANSKSKRNSKSFCKLNLFRIQRPTL